MPEKTIPNVRATELQDGDVIVGSYNSFSGITVKRTMPHALGTILRIKTSANFSGTLAQVVEKVGDNTASGKGSWLSTRSSAYLSDADVEKLIEKSGGVDVLVEGDGGLD